jgi:uncharacterized protein (TIGR03067 family)
MIRSAILATVFALAVPAATQDAAKEAAAKALASVQGTWAIVTVNGESNGGMTMSLTFTGDKYAQTTNGAVDERGAIKIDPAKKPMAIDLIITEGNDAGKLQLGIFELNGDTMLFVILKKAK